jgi:LPPG:FO 2-phospho-L-lactate transferase
VSGNVLALSGGIGGAKLALGLARVVDAGKLIVVANTADDFRHLGLAISPDVDTLIYTLADLADPAQGWGRRDESWSFMAALEQLGGETWFRLGDRDLAMHVERTRRLAGGETLGTITDDVRRRLGISTAVVPMSDDAVQTRLRTDEGLLEFQDYFVRRRCTPIVREVVYRGAERARPAQALLAALTDPQLRAVVICPSNPLLSIEPILALPGVRSALADCRAPVVAVSPVINGQAIKGPTVKMMRELGMDASAAGIARLYADVIDAVVVDESDSRVSLPAGMQCVCAPILMSTLEDRERLAAAVLDAADRIAIRRR